MSVFSTVTLICFYSGYTCNHLLLHISEVLVFTGKWDYPTGCLYTQYSSASLTRLGRVWFPPHYMRIDFTQYSTTKYVHTMHYIIIFGTAVVDSYWLVLSYPAAVSVKLIPMLYSLSSPLPLPWPCRTAYVC